MVHRHSLLLLPKLSAFIQSQEVSGIVGLIQTIVHLLKKAAICISANCCFKASDNGASPTQTVLIFINRICIRADRVERGCSYNISV
jgi:hypothetical protein